MEFDGNENTAEKYFDDVESVLSCRWQKPALWWKGDDELGIFPSLLTIWLLQEAIIYGFSSN